MQPLLVASKEDGRDNGAEEGDDDEARDAQHPGQGAVLPFVASRLRLKFPPARVCETWNHYQRAYSAWRLESVADFFIQGPHQRGGGAFVGRVVYAPAPARRVRQLYMEGYSHLSPRTRPCSVASSLEVLVSMKSQEKILRMTST